MADQRPALHLSPAAGAINSTVPWVGRRTADPGPPPAAVTCMKNSETEINFALMGAQSQLHSAGPARSGSAGRTHFRPRITAVRTRRNSEKVWL